MRRYIGLIMFVTLFIAVVSIISILIAKGYNFTGNEIKENGILNVVSNPEGAKIYIDGEEKTATPKKIELVAGKYEIKITKENYKEWKKEVHVEASIVTDLSATLFPTELNLEQLTFSNLDKAFFSNDGDIALYTITTEPTPGIWLIKLEKTIFELSSSQPTKIADLNLIPGECLQEKKYSIGIASDNLRAILECDLESYKTFYLLDLRNQNSVPMIINEELGFNPDSIDFSFDSENVFVSDSEIIANFNLATKDLSLILRKQDNYQTQITPFGKGFLLLQYSYDGEDRNLFRLSQDLEKTVLDPGEEIEVESITSISGSLSNSDMFAFSTAETSVIFNTKQAHTSAPLPFSEKEVEILQWSPNGSSLLFKEDNLLRTANIKSYPDGTYKVKTFTIIENFDPSIYHVAWSNNSQQILINDLSKKKFSAIDKDGNNQTSLFTGETTYPASFILSKNETFLVLLLEDDNGYSNLYSVKLKI